MRNILEKVRKADYDEVKRHAQAIYLAESRTQAEAAFRSFRSRWRKAYGPMAVSYTHLDVYKRQGVAEGRDLREAAGQQT